MSNIVPLHPNVINENAIQTVNARELHGFLGVGRDYTTWINARIEKYGFTEGDDFVVASGLSSPNPGSSKARRQQTLEYFITLDMAKELAMVENNEKGREARRYFIECERKFREASSVPLTGKELIAKALIEATKTMQAQAQRIEDMREDVEAHERLTKADGSLTVTEVAKNLGMRPKDLFQWLSANRWIYKRPGAAHWLGYQPRCNSGDLEHKSTTVLRADGSEKITEQVRVTPQGLSKLAKLIKPVVEIAS